MSEKKEINYLLRCHECNLALFKSRRISKLPIKQGYHCYGCDKDVNFSYSDVELIIEPRGDFDNFSIEDMTRTEGE